MTERFGRFAVFSFYKLPQNIGWGHKDHPAFCPLRNQQFSFFAIKVLKALNTFSGGAVAFVGWSGGTLGARFSSVTFAACKTQSYVTT
jgi:hypothetical protein